jgi:hypothetical protein
MEYENLRVLDAIRAMTTGPIAAKCPPYINSFQIAFKTFFII